MKVKMIILTKSSKNGGFCVAGINVETGSWIRLVTEDPYTDGAVPEDDAKYSNGNPVEVLDCVEVNLIKHLPTKAQQENYVYQRVCWKFVKKYSIDEVLKIHPLDVTEKIFGSYENYITPEQVDGHSLLLIKVDEPEISITEPEHNNDNNRKKYFHFINNNKQYCSFNISDNVLKESYSRKPDGKYPLSDGYAVVSLTNEHTPLGWTVSRHYKMLAQYFPINND